jgi:hypothetical protein
MFYEQRNLAVMTTKQAFAGEPVLYVCHGPDGEWQFLPHLGPSMSDGHFVDAALVSITIFEDEQQP